MEGLFTFDVDELCDGNVNMCLAFFFWCIKNDLIDTQNNPRFDQHMGLKISTINLIPSLDKERNIRAFKFFDRINITFFTNSLLDKLTPDMYDDYLEGKINLLSE